LPFLIRTHQLTHWAKHDPPHPPPTYHAANSVLAPTAGTTPNYHQLLRGRMVTSGNKEHPMKSVVLPKVYCLIYHQVPIQSILSHFPHYLPGANPPTYVLSQSINHTKKINIGCALPVVVIVSIILVRSALKQQISLLPNFYSTLSSTPGARFAAFDIKNFYRNNPMERYDTCGFQLVI
jgi:hypothetical protein